MNLGMNPAIGMEFRRKTVQDMGDWLKEECFSDSVVVKFKGTFGFCCLPCFHCTTTIIIIDNEIDGDAFTLLKDEDILSLVSIGAARKLISKR